MLAVHLVRVLLPPSFARSLRHAHVLGAISPLQAAIDSKRAYNINILMGSKIKIPIDQLRDAVVQLDPRAFASEEVRLVGRGRNGPACTAMLICEGLRRGRRSTAGVGA